MTNAHTKGPWDFGPGYTPGDSKFDLFGPGGRQVIACAGYENMWLSTYDKDTDAANARLIAAAPDLLEALRGCLPYIRDMDDDGPAGEGWQSERLSRFIADARAAIAKATSTEQGERG